MKINNLFKILPLVILLAGCSSGSEKHVKLNLQYTPTPNTPINATDRNAQAQLAEAANSVSSSLQELSAIQMATHPTAKLPAPLSPRVTGLTEVASINWNGPVAPILEKIAKAGGYRLHVLGREPTIPIIINVNANNETLATILRNVTFQAAPNAHISVYPEYRTIELRYNSN